MKLIPQSENLQDYVGELPPVIVYSSPAIQKQIEEIKSKASTQKIKS